MLKLCLMKCGIGRWVQILDTGLLPGKLIQQLNGQTQRLLGQQSLAGISADHFWGHPVYLLPDVCINGQCLLFHSLVLFSR